MPIVLLIAFPLYAGWGRNAVPMGLAIAIPTVTTVIALAARAIRSPISAVFFSAALGLGLFLTLLVEQVFELNPNSQDPAWFTFLLIGIAPGCAIGFLSRITTPPETQRRLNISVFGLATALQARVRQARDRWFIISCVCLLIVLGFEVLLIGPLTLLTAGAFVTTALLAGLGILVGFALAYGVALVIGTRAGVALEALEQNIASQVQVVGRPILGFAFGYFIILIVFAGWYVAGNFLNPDAAFGRMNDKGELVRGGTDIRFADMVYFSMNTIAPLGYSELRPLSLLMRLLAFLELTTGIGWTVVVFAIVLRGLD